MSGRLPALFDSTSMYGQLSAGFFPEDNLRGFFLRRREQALATRPRAVPPPASSAASMTTGWSGAAVVGAGAAPARQPRDKVQLETVYSFLVSPDRIAAGSPIRVFHQIEHHRQADQLTLWLEGLDETVTACRFFLLNRKLLELFQPDFPELFGTDEELSTEQIQSILQRVLNSPTLRENRSVAQKLARRAMLDIRCYQGTGRHTLSIPQGSPFLEADTWAVVAIHETQAAG